MKVLVTGGYGFIGAYIVERFFKEGHDICIIDDLSTGHKSNVACKHRLYNIKTEDSKCEEVFLANKFDLVIHCASNESIENSIKTNQDQPNDMLGLINIISLVNKYSIKHIIYLSSTDIYGSSNQMNISESQPAEPKSSFAFSKLTGEQYLMAWNNFVKINVLCLRLSYVYGPRQRDDSRFNVVAETNKILYTEIQDLDENIGYDLIYIEDVADAIYRSAMCELTGIYNLSSNTRFPVSQISGEIMKSGRSRRKARVFDNNAPQKGCTYDNSLLKEALDWSPIYTFEDGLRKTIEWSIKEQNASLTYSIKKKKRFIVRLKPLFKSLLPFFENCVLFSCLLVASVYFKKIYESNAMTLLMLYILLMGILHGSRQSIISIIFSLFLFFFGKMSNGENLMTLLYDTEVLLNFSILTFVGIYIGFSVDKMQQKAIKNEEKIVLLNERYKFLQEINKENVMIKNTLQEQVINSQESFGKVFNIITDLNSFEPERILFSAVRVIESIMKNKQVAIYSLTQNRSYLRLIASSEKSLFRYPRSQKTIDNDQYDQVIKTGIVFVNKEFDKNVPFFIAPIKNESTVIGLIMLYQPDFDIITLHYKNLFQVVSGLISISVSRAMQYSKLANDNSYIDGTMIINQSSFRKLAMSKIKIYQEFSIPYTILKVDNDIDLLNEDSISLLANLRESDLVGLVDNSIYILLPNVYKAESNKVIERLTNQGFKITSESGINDG